MISKVLLAWASEDIYWVIMEMSVFLPTKPTPTISTLSTGHMITSRYFFQSDFTFRAITNISIVSCPTEELLVHCLLAFYISVPLDTTVKAYLHPAFALDLSFLAFLYIIVAIRPRTPFKIGVHININIFLELQIFGVNV